MPAELPAARLSNFAKFSGATTPRRKPPGNEKKICSRITLTYLLANPNLEGEIHLKGGRFVTSQISIWNVIHRSSCISYFYCNVGSILENSTQLKDPRRELGISLFSYLGFFSNAENRIIDFIYFIFRYFYYQKFREGIK